MLRAVGVSRSFGGQTVLATCRSSSTGATGSASSGPTASASRRCCACWPASSSPTPGRSSGPRPRSPSATCPRSPTPGRARPCSTTWPGAPASPSRVRRARPAHRGARRRARLGRRLHRRPSTASWPSAATTSTPGRPRCAPPSGSRSATAAGSPRPAATLSGGEAARAALAAILLSRVDVLLLDEPTNNLDFAGIDLLEAFVDGFAGAVMVVSHDRAFLDRCVRRIVEIDEHSHRAREFAGGWSDYIAGARPGPGPAVRGPRQVRVRARPAPAAPAHPDRSGARRGVRRAKTSGEPDKNVRAAKIARSEKQAGEGQGHRAQDRPARGGRQAVGGLAPAAEPGAGGAQRRRGGPPRRARVVEAGATFRLGSDRPRGRLAGPAGHPRAQRQRQDHAAAGAARRGAARGRAALARARRAGRASSTSRRGLFAGRRPACWPRSRSSTGMALSESRSLLAKFGLGADHVDRAGPRPLAGRAHAGRCSPRSWPRASTASCSTSPPTTSTSRPSSSSSRPSPPSRARSCWSPTTAASSKPSHVTRTVELA